MVSVALATAALAACSQTDGGGGLFGKKSGVVTVPSDSSYSPDIFLKAGYCPPIQIRPDTEALVLYVKGHDGEDSFVRFQGSITDIARECHATGPDTLTIKAGVAGRIAAGPKGTPGAVAATLRIAVVKQSDLTVLYTQAFKVTATLGPPDFSAPFSEVADNISFKVGPGDRDLIIWVGFDSGTPKAKPTG